MERLSRAHESSDLSESVEGPGDVDWLRASGMVAQRHGLALSVMRLIEDRDKQELTKVFTGMLALLPRTTSSPAMKVSNVLGWMLDPRCPDCGGRGYAQIPGTPTLAAQPCKTCDGSGQSSPRWDEAERNLHAVVQELMDNASAAIARKLKS